MKKNDRRASYDCRYERKYNSLLEEYDALELKTRKLEKERTERHLKADVLSTFLFEIHELDELDMEFSEKTWNAIVDEAIVDREYGITFKFNNGEKIRVEGK